MSALASNRDVWAILGMPLDNVTLAEAAERVEQAIEHRERLSFVTPNVNWMVRALKNRHALRQIINADLSIADGVPVVWLARQLGMPLKERVAGADLFELLRRQPRDTSLPIRVFFFGGRDGAAETATEVLRREQGRMIAVGWHNPGFGDVESMSSDEVLAKINAAEPDFLIVSLGAAKGQAWIEHNQNQLEVPVMAHLGAVVDFVAGSIKRAPTWVSRLGLEWIWRILAEPSLWKRYWNDGTDLIRLTRRRLGLLKRLSKPSDPPHAIESELTGAELKLRGDLIHAHREQLKTALATTAGVTGDLTLDMTGVMSADASALGQIRMLEQGLIRRGAALEVKANPPIHAALKAANMIF